MESTAWVSEPKSLPLVSIITPVYNGAAYLEETLQSICDSTYENIELIVVDDGSTDSSAALARALLAKSTRQHQVFSKPNSGEADSDNFGLAQSQGEFIAFINADDPIHAELVAESVKVFLERPEVIVTYPDWQMIDHVGKHISYEKPRNPSLDLIIGDVQCLPGPGAFIRRAAIPGPEIRKKKYRFVSDYEQWLSLSILGEFYKIPKVLASWRRHPMQQTTAMQGKLLAQEIVEVIDNFFKRTDLPESALKLQKQARSQSLYTAAVQSLYGQHVRGRSLLLKSLLTVYRRRSGIDVERRKLVVMLMILVNPLGRLYLQKQLKPKVASD